MQIPGRSTANAVVVAAGMAHGAGPIGDGPRFRNRGVKGNVERGRREETGHGNEPVPVPGASCLAPMQQRRTEGKGDGNSEGYKPAVVGRDVLGRHFGCLAEEGDLRVGLVDEKGPMAYSAMIEAADSMTTHSHLVGRCTVD